jgi:acetyl-CoA synthetase
VSEVHRYPIPENFKHAAIDPESYRVMYQTSITQPDAFWAEQARQFLTWHKPWSQVSKSDLRKGEVAWFLDGQLNVSVNCIDRHLSTCRSTSLYLGG